MPRKDDTDDWLAIGAMNRQFEVVLRGDPATISEWIAAAIHQEGFDVAEGTFEYPGGWTLRYATIGDNTKAFWWDMLDEVAPFLRKRMGFIAAAWLIRTEGEAIRVVMSAFLSRYGVEGMGIAAGRVRDVASGLSSAVGTDLVSYRATAVVEKTFNAREFRRVTSWDSRR